MICVICCRVRRYSHSFSQDGEDYWAEPLPRDPRGQGWGETPRVRRFIGGGRVPPRFYNSIPASKQSRVCRREQMDIPSVLVFLVNRVRQQKTKATLRRYHCATRSDVRKGAGTPVSSVALKHGLRSAPDAEI